MKSSLDLMKTLKIGIAGYDQMKARTMAIARGQRKLAKGEPTVWFTSVESLANPRQSWLDRSGFGEREGALGASKQMLQMAVLQGCAAIVKRFAGADRQ